MKGKKKKKVFFNAIGFGQLLEKKKTNTKGMK